MTNLRDINTFEVSETGLYKGRPAKIQYMLGQRFNFPAANVLHDICEISIDRPSGAPDNYRVYMPDENGSNSTYDVEVVSTSANDTNTTGTGVQQVQVDYLDASWNEQSVIVNMNGTTAVTAGITARRVNDFHSYTTGSLAVADGNITLRTAAASAIQSPWTGQQELGYLAQGGNKDMTAVYTVPLGKHLFLDGVQVSSANSDQSIRVRANVDPDTRLRLADPKIFLFHSVSLIGSNRNAHKDNHWIKFPEKSDLKISCSPTGTGADSSCHATFFLVDDA